MSHVYHNGHAAGGGIVKMDSARTEYAHEGYVDSTT